MKRKQHYILGRELIALPALKGCRVLSGEESLNNCILSSNIMEVPDIQNWVQEGDLLVTTGYPFKDHPEKMVRLAELLVEKGVAALAIKPRRYIQEIPAELVKLAGERGLLLIELGENAVFSDIMYETVQAISYKGIADFLKAQGQVDRILSQLNLEDSQEKMLSVVEQELGHSFLFADSQNHTWSGRGKADREQFRYFKNFSTAAGEVVELYIGKEEPDITPEQERVLDSIFPILRFQMRNDSLMQQKIMEYKNRFLINLLEGTIVDSMDILLFAEEYGIHFKQDQKYLVGIFCCDKGMEQPKLPRIKHHFRNWSKRYTMALVNGAFVVILEQDGREEAVLEEAMQKMREILGDSLYAALGSPQPLTLLAVAYREAVRVAQVSEKCRIHRSIVRQSDLGIFSLLSLIPDQAESFAYAERLLGDLGRYHSENGGNLLETLEAYLENGCNAKLTARKLFIHYNTMLYRLEKIQQILGMELENTDNRLQLQVALKLYAMRPAAKEEAYGQEQYKTGD